MKKASITETKSNLSALIDGLKGREPGEQSGRLSRLIRDGVARPRLTVAPAVVFTSPLPSAGASAVNALIKERREGR
jgi:hypothetical protein